nr:MAG: nonstructural protein [Microvirus sp.]
MKLFTICDTAADHYANPTASPSIPAFTRDVAMALKNPPQNPSAFHENPKDFKLYCIGDYDTSTGVITPIDPPQYLGNAEEFASPVASAA